MFFSNIRTLVLMFFCCFLIFPKNLFAANELQPQSSSSQFSSPSSATVPPGGGSGAHEKAKSGTTLGAVLTAIGTVSLGVSIAACTSSAGTLCWKIPLDLAAIAGGIMAMTQNSKAASDTAPRNINFGGITSGGLNSGMPTIPGDIPNVNIAEKCREAPNTCTCNDAACSQPQLKIPSKDELEKLLRSGQMPDGTSLDDALAQLNENYEKALEGANKFNKLSSAGAFDPSNTGIGGLGDGTTSNSENPSEDSKGQVGLDSGVKSSTGDDSDDDSQTEPMIDILAKLRGEQNKALLMGMNAFDSKSGKALTIFERQTRVLRGKNDRDLVLAKNEWIRKKALKNKKNSVKLK